MPWVCAMSQTVLRIRDLMKSYRSPDGDESSVIAVPAFTMDAGQQVALVGESGSGKTTFLNLIAGILKADMGVIELAGRDIATLSQGARDVHRAKHLGFVFQTFNLLQGYTALENVIMGMTFGPGADRVHAKSLLERMGLGDRLRHKPSQLSVGQQQRVAVARAVANRPSLVLADEPTGNLDKARARDTLDLIREVCREQNAALLWVSHDETLLSEFDDVRQLSDINRAAVAAGHDGGATDGTTGGEDGGAVA